jgi:hypothetical protein
MSLNKEVPSMYEFVEVSASDECAISVSESVETFVMVSASDELTISVEEQEG